MSRKLESLLADSRNNNFNMIRLCMALAVLYNHSFIIFDNNGNRDAVTYLFGHFDGGSLGVSVFFLVSGLLLSQSFFKTGSPSKFILKRLLRIFPGLLVCLFFTVFLVGAINTALPLKQYLLARGTYRYFYNILLNNEFFFFDLPGCFLSNRLPAIVNGSLWTLPFELICYIFLFLSFTAYVFIATPQYSHLKKLFTLLLVFFFASYLLNATYLFERFRHLVMGYRLNLNEGNNPLPLFLFFGIGMLFYLVRSRLRLNIFYWVGLCLLLVISHFFSIIQVQWFLEVCVIAYGVMVWAGLPQLFRFNFKKDPSYGIYLYAWPVQQTFAHYFNLTAYQSMLYTIPVVALLGWLSYILIEKPAMNSAGVIHSRWLMKKPLLQTESPE